MHTLKDLQILIIWKRLKRLNWNRTKTAKSLDISVRRVRHAITYLKLRGFKQFFALGISDFLGELDISSPKKVAEIIKPLIPAHLHNYVSARRVRDFLKSRRKASKKTT